MKWKTTEKFDIYNFLDKKKEKKLKKIIFNVPKGKLQIKWKIIKTLTEF